MKHTYVALLATAVLTGCSSTSRYESEHQVTTRIHSDPPGARIEINGDYIGDAPVDAHIRHHPSDKVVMGKVVVRALPVESGQHVQLLELNGPQFPFDNHRDVVPETIEFDMRLAPLGGVAARGAGSSGKYVGIGETRWINKTIDRGVYVELDDGSLWRIMPGDITKTSLWAPSESVVVHENMDPEYPYALAGSRGKVEAKFIPQ